MQPNRNSFHTSGSQTMVAGHNTYTPTPGGGTPRGGNSSSRANELNQTMSCVYSNEDSAQRQQRMEHFMLQMEKMQHVFDCFASFGGSLNSFNEMDGTHFTRMLREAGIIDRKTFTAVDADLLFRRIKEKDSRVVSVRNFLCLGVPEVAARRKLSKETVKNMLYAASEAFVEVPVPACQLKASASSFHSTLSPNRSRPGTANSISAGAATPPRFKLVRPRSSSPRGGRSYSGGPRVRLHDDTSTYTGVHKHTGGPSIVDRDPADLSRVVDRRRSNDVRGAVV